MEKPVVIKFGGTSVSTKERLKIICDVTVREKEISPVVVVVSALSGVTDLLLFLSSNAKGASVILNKIRKKHEELINSFWNDSIKQKELMAEIDKNLSEIKELIKRKVGKKKFTDNLVSYGEKMSAGIISSALKSTGIDSAPVFSARVITTNNNFGNAEFIVEPTCINIKNVIMPLLNKGTVPVVTGFIGSTQNGFITTLGRGGSDYSASIIGFCLKAREIQIWTDVNGVCTADPRIVKKAKCLSEISYKEVSEMAYFGAKVLHPRTLKPAMSSKISVKVLNTMDPSFPGTRISANSNKRTGIKAISYKKNVTLVNIYSTEMFLAKGFLVKIFEIFSRHNMSVDLIGVSEVSVSLTLDNEEGLSEAVKDLQKFTNVAIRQKISLISLIGEGITEDKNILPDVFTILNKKNVPVKMISFGSTNVNISFAVETENIGEIVNILHNKILLKRLHGVQM